MPIDTNEQSRASTSTASMDRLPIPPPSLREPVEHHAFIAYSREDTVVAQYMREWLASFNRPMFARRALDICVDRHDFNMEEAWPQIRTNLLRSEYLVLFASEESSHHVWVTKELCLWLSDGKTENIEELDTLGVNPWRRQRLIIARTSGEWKWSEPTRDMDWAATTCLPSWLHGKFPGLPPSFEILGLRGLSRDELAAHAQLDRDLRRLAATLHGVPPKTLEASAQRRQRTLRWTITSLIVGFVVLTTFLAVALVRAKRTAGELRTSKDEAERQARLAEEYEARARRDAEHAEHARVEAEQALMVARAYEAADLVNDPLRQDEALTLVLDAIETVHDDEAPAAVERALTKIVSWTDIGSRLTGEGGDVASIEYRPDGQQLLTHWPSAMKVSLSDPVAGVKIRDIEIGDDQGWARLVSGGTRIVTGGQLGVRLWDIESGNKRGGWSFDCGVTRAAVSSTDDRIAIVDCGTIAVFDIHDKQRTRLDYTGDVYALAFSPDGAHLALVTSKNLRIWSTGTWAQQDLKLENATAGLWFSPDGRHIIAGPGTQFSHDEGWAEVLSLGQHGQFLFSPTGERWLFTPDTDRSEMDSWAPDTPSRITSTHGSFCRPWSMAHHPTRAMFAIGCSDGTVQLRDAENMKMLNRVRAHRQLIDVLIFSPTGTQLATGSWDGTVGLWEVESSIPATYTFDGVAPRSLRYLSDGRVLVSSASGGDGVHLWDPSHHTHQLFHAADVGMFAVDEAETILAGFDGKGATLWNLRDGSMRDRVDLGREDDDSDSVAVRTLTQVGSRVYLGMNDGEIETLDLVTAKHRRSRWTINEEVNLLVASPGDETLIAGSWENETVHLWSIRSPRVPGAELDGHRRGARSAVFTPAGHIVAIGDASGGLSLWDVEATTLLMRMPAHRGAVNELLFSADGRWLVSGSEDMTVRVWSTQDWSLHRELVGHTDEVSALAMTRDGQRLVSSGFDMVRVWKPETGELLAELPDNANGLAIALSPDESRFVVGGFGNVHEWPLRLDPWIEAACLRLGKPGAARCDAQPSD